MFFWAISNSFLRRIIFFFSISSAELNPYIRKSKNVGIQYCSREWLLLPSCLFFPFLFLVFASVSKYFLATFVAPGAANGTPRYRESGQLFLPAWFGIFSLEYLNACTFARSFSLPRIVFFFSTAIPPTFPKVQIRLRNYPRYALARDFPGTKKAFIRPRRDKFVCCRLLANRPSEF